ncbi:MAG: right-handed parallel beta-helix repeat-containing protein, partial [Spirochaetota bacterium]
GSNSWFTNCWFSNNTASFTNATLHFSNVAAVMYPAIISNCVFYGSGVAQNAIPIFEHAAEMTNHVIVSNCFYTNTLKYLYVETSPVLRIISNDQVSQLNIGKYFKHDATNARWNIVMPQMMIASNTNTGALYFDLQSAVNGANDGNEIRVRDMVLTRGDEQLNALALTNGVFITNKNNLRIIGGYDAAFASVTGHSVLDGGGAALSNRLLYIANLTNLAMSNFVIQRGGSNAGTPSIDGSGVLVSNIGFSLLSNIIVSNCVSRDGGGINVVLCSNSVLSADVVRCTASNNGGGVQLFRSRDTICSGTLGNNNALTYGGGLLLYYCSNITVNAAIASNNGQYGGGVTLLWVTNSTMNSTIASNYASGNGGGYYIYDGSGNTVNGLVTNNSAVVIGGGVSVEYTSNNIVNADVVYNKCAFGGGISVYYANDTTVNSIIADNTATSESGGGIFMTCDLRSRIYATLLSNTAVASSGGGIALLSSTNAIVSSSLYSNKAVTGGGVFVFSGSNNNFTSCYFSNNTATWTNAIMHFSNVAAVRYPVTISNCVFYGGGNNAIPMFEQTAEMTNHVIVSNCFYTNTLKYLYVDYGGPIISNDQVSQLNIGKYFKHDATNAAFNIVMPRTIIASNTNSGVLYSDLQSAVHGANDGNEIRVRDMVLTRTDEQLNALALTNGVFITNKNNLRIIGGYDAAFAVQTGYTVLDGMGSSSVSNRLVYIANLTNLSFDGFVIQRGGSNAGVPQLDGTGVYAVGIARSFISNVIVSNNSSTNGGGIALSACTNIVLDVHVFRNTNAYFGGGISLDSCISNVVNGSVAQNSAGDNGGGVSLYRDRSSIVNADVGSNFSSTTGGGVELYLCSNSRVTGSMFSNTGNGGGGGAHVWYSTNCSITGALINNYAPSGCIGGGLYLIYGSNNTIDATISNNIGGIGGGVVIRSSMGNVIRGVISDNTNMSSIGGGGVLLYFATNSVIENAVFSNNSSVYAGGAIHVNSGSNNVIRSCFFSNNITGATNSTLYFTNVMAKNDAYVVSNCVLMGGGG